MMYIVTENGNKINEIENIEQYILSSNNITICDIDNMFTFTEYIKKIIESNGYTYKTYRVSKFISNLPFYLFSAIGAVLFIWFFFCLLKLLMDLPRDSSEAFGFVITLSGLCLSSLLCVVFCCKKMKKFNRDTDYTIVIHSSKKLSIVK